MKPLKLQSLQHSLSLPEKQKEWTPQERIDIDKLGVKPLLRRAKKCLGGVEFFRRKMAQQYWLAGEALAAAERKAKHGTWMDLLEAAGIPYSTATQCIQIYERLSREQTKGEFVTRVKEMAGIVKAKGEQTLTAPESQPKSQPLAGQPTEVHAVVDGRTFCEFESPKGLIDIIEKGTPHVAGRDVTCRECFIRAQDVEVVPLCLQPPGEDAKSLPAPEPDLPPLVHATVNGNWFCGYYSFRSVSDNLKKGKPYSVDGVTCRSCFSRALNAGLIPKGTPWPPFRKPKKPIDPHTHGMIDGKRFCDLGMNPLLGLLEGRKKVPNVTAGITCRDCYTLAVLAKLIPCETPFPAASKVPSDRKPDHRIAARRPLNPEAIGYWVEVNSYYHTITITPVEVIDVREDDVIVRPSNGSRLASREDHFGRTVKEAFEKARVIVERWRDSIDDLLAKIDHGIRQADQAPATEEFEVGRSTPKPHRA